MTRRTALAGLTAAPALAQQRTSDPLQIAIGHSNRGVESLLKAQVMDPASRWYGMLINGFGIPVPASMAGMFDTYGVALMHPQSKYYRNAEVFIRLKITAAQLLKNLSSGGFYSNLDTNFNSPPDTAFGVRAAAQALLIAKQTGSREILEVMSPFLKTAADGLAVGGIHTPNHRWVLCAALAQVNEVLPNPAYGRRIDQWLAEGIDIDEDGQFTERSTGGYNPIIDSALIAIAEKHNRPELFDDVRANLNSLLYLIQPNGEVVTDFSRRQDQFTIATPINYYFSLHYMALKDKNKAWGNLAAKYRADAMGLSTAMLYPDFLKPIETGPLPTSYRQDFNHNKVTRIRRGDHSATVFYNGSNRVMNLSKGKAVVTTVRFISAFFGKAQFKSVEHKLDGGMIQMSQRLDGPYYQPFMPTRKIDSEMWDSTQKSRPRTDVSKYEQSATFVEAEGGYDLRIRASGTEWVPVTIEISFRAGGALTGVKPVPNTPDSYLIDGKEARYRVGNDVIRVSPGLSDHHWTRDMRYIEPKLPGPTLYLCGFAPLDHTIRFRFA
ncbi:MAG: hypothetical protein FJW36_00035 [Acidobacteria bacterium]|nr:hypothetical protein [Acidobacteriota bacterium]